MGKAKERIQSVADELFYRFGINATGIDEIVEKANVAKMTLYKNFQSKDNLVLDFLQERDRKWNEHLESFTKKCSTPEERILAVFDALNDWIEDKGFRGCAFINTAVEIADFEHPAFVFARRHKRRLRNYFKEQLIEAGSYNPEEDADQLLILFEGAIITAQMESIEKPLSKARLAAKCIVDKKG